MFEAVFSVVTSGFLGFILMELKDLRALMNKIENDVLILKHNAPERRGDIDRE